MLLKNLLFLILLTFLSCNSEKGPSSSLRDFLNYRFSNNQSLDGVLGFVDGDFKSMVESLKDDDLKKFLDSSKINKSKLKLKVKKCDQLLCFITYTLSYKQTGKDDNYTVDVKKIAELHLIGKKWKVTSVTNIKSNIEAQKGLDISI